MGTGERQYFEIEYFSIFRVSNRKVPFVEISKSNFSNSRGQ